MIRYPGGTITQDWGWRTVFPKNKTNAKENVHPLTDFKKLVDVTGVKTVFEPVTLKAVAGLVNMTEVSFSRFI